MTDVRDVFLVEAVAYDPNLGATRTLRYATGQGHVTGPAETPASTHYDGRVKQPVSVTRTMFGAGTTRGRSTTGYGDIELLNGDGMLDDLIAYSFDGRAITVRRGNIGAAYPASFTTDLVATMGVPEITQEKVVLKLRDRQAEVNVPLQTTKYSGAGLGTLEGTSSDLKGKPKPVTFGQVFNITPPCVETAKLIYQINDATISTLDAVYDRGVALVDHGSNYATTADLLDNTQAPASGKFKLYKGSEGSYFRLGAAPSGLITCDLTEGAAASDRTVAQVYKRLLVKAGKSASDYSAGDLTTLDTAANYVIGFYQDQETEYGPIFDQVASSVGAAWYIDSDGVFRIKQLLAPTGTAVYDFTQNDLLKPLLRITTNDPSQGIPTYQTVVRYQRNYTQQVVDIASSVTVARKAFLADEWREAKSTDTSIQTAHLLAAQSVEDSLLTVEANASTEAGRRQSLFGIARDLYELVVQYNAGTAVIDLNDVISLTHTRYHLSVVGSATGATVGGLLRVIGLASNGADRTLTITAWGISPSVGNRITDDGSYRVTSDGGYRTVQAA